MGHRCVLQECPLVNWHRVSNYTEAGLSYQVLILKVCSVWLSATAAVCCTEIWAPWYSMSPTKRTCAKRLWCSYVGVISLLGMGNPASMDVGHVGLGGWVVVGGAGVERCRKNAHILHRYWLWEMHRYTLLEHRNIGSLRELCRWHRSSVWVQYGWS